MTLGLPCGTSALSFRHTQAKLSYATFLSEEGIEVMRFADAHRYDFAQRKLCDAPHRATKKKPFLYKTIKNHGEQVAVVFFIRDEIT